MHFAIIDHQIHSLEKTKEWFSFHYPKTYCFFANNGHELLLYLNKTKPLPTIIFMEMNTPILDGCTASFYLRHKHPLQKIIGFSPHANYEMVRQAFMSGVNGFIFKKEVKTVLKEAIETVLKGDYYIDSRFSETLNPFLLNKIIAHRNLFWGKLYSRTSDELPENTSLALTDRERQLLILITSSLGYKEIAEIMCIQIKSVENLAQRLCKKLGVKTMKELLLFSLKYGFSMQSNLMFSNVILSK